MNLLDLPLEVGVLIFSYLDTRSKITIYNCNSGLRKFFAPCHMKRVTLSRNVIGKVKTLKENIFVDLGKYVQELNLSCVPNLTAKELKDHISLMSNLKHLDITFTDIYLSDFVPICPEKLKKLSANFFKNPRTSRFSDTWEASKELFKERQFTKVHLIVFDLIDSEIPLTFLKEVPIIEDLKITVADNYKDFWELDEEDSPFTRDDDVEINFSKLNYVFRDCRVTHKTSKFLRGVANLDYSRLEYIFIMYLEKIVIYVSPIFRSTFMVHCSDLQVEVSYFLPQNFMLDGNIVFKAWNKETTIFDDNFFNNVSQELIDYFPTYVCMHKFLRMKVTPSPSQWFCIDDCDGFEYLITDLPEKVTLTNFCRSEGTVIRNTPISLRLEAQSLRSLTFLRLSNIRLKEDFFAVLFASAKRLNTLDLYVEKRGRLGRFGGLLSKSIHLTRSLKNLKLTSENVYYESLFKTLSKCPSLENVHICEYERASGNSEISVFDIRLMIEKCVNLYSLFIEADMSPESLTLLMSPLRDAAQRNNRDHLTIEVCDCYRGWNPFADVFNPSPLHILD